jgi:putative ABC transport system permease protein
MSIAHLPVTLRSLARRPGWTAAVVLVLALGSGVAGAVGAVAWATLLRPLPYADPGRLVALFAVERQGSEPRNPTSPADFLDWKRRCGDLRAMSAAFPKAFTLTGAGMARELPALAAPPELFAMLGVEAALGRTFGPGDVATEPRQVVLGDELWRRELGGDPNIVGRTLTLDGEPYTVAGVMPAEFRFPPFWATQAEAWVPLVFTPEQAADRSAQFLRVFARLAPGASVESARAQLAAVGADLARSEPADRRRGTNLEPLREPTVAAVRPALLLLLTGAGLLLVVAGASAANLLLARAIERRPELTLRAALGVSRGRRVREALAESATLATAGGLLGLLLSRALVALVVARFPAFLPPVVRLGLDVAGAALPLLAAAAATLVAALAATLGPTRFELLRGTRATGGGERARARLIGVQVALAVVLVAGAAVTARALWQLSQLDPGFAAEGVLAVDLSLAASPAGADAATQDQFYAQLVSAAAALPGVEAAGVVNHLPLRGDFWRNGMEVEGEPAPPGATPPNPSFRVVTPGLFRTLGVPLRAGRGFDGRDTAAGEPVVVVNAALAARHLGGPAAAVGRRLRLSGHGEGWRRVVGVVADMQQTSLLEAPQPEVYYPSAQNPIDWYAAATLVVRGATAPPTLASVAAVVARLDPAVALARPQALREVVADETATQRLQLLLVATFAAAALLLALAGVYGMARVFVATRTVELGVRQALGADRRRLLLMVLAAGARVAVPAVLAGGVLAIAAVRLLVARVPGLPAGTVAGSAAITAAAAAAVGALATLAVWLQARRAAAVEPMAALRRGSSF